MKRILKLWLHFLDEKETIPMPALWEGRNFPVEAKILDPFGKRRTPFLEKGKDDPKKFWYVPETVNALMPVYEGDWYIEKTISLQPVLSVYRVVSIDRENMKATIELIDFNEGLGWQYRDVMPVSVKEAAESLWEEED